MNFHTCHQGLFFTCVPFDRFMQFAAYIIKWYFTSLILSWSTIYEADILHSYKHIVPFLVRRNMSQLVGRDPNERLWQAHKQNWTPQRLTELSDISGCDFLTVFRSRFKPKEQRHPSPSTVRRTGLETVSDVIVPTLFETYARNCSYYTTASPVPRILLCTSDWWWQVLSTKQESISR